jgi:hypothetical protein
MPSVAATELMGFDPSHRRDFSTGDCPMGFYTSVAMTLAFYDVPADAPGMAR